MKKFAGNKRLVDIKVQCGDQGLTFDDRLYREEGYDTVQIKGGGCTVTYNTFNGGFFGVTPDGTMFDSRSTEHENEPWFQALLSFFYVEKGPANG